MADLRDGDSTRVRGSSGTLYELKNVGGVYSCSCPAWRNQSRTNAYRTCGHLLDYRGPVVEAERISPAGLDGMPATVLRRVQRYMTPVTRTAAPVPVMSSTSTTRGPVWASNAQVVPVGASAPAPVRNAWNRLVEADPFDPDPSPAPEPAPIVGAIPKAKEELAVLLAHSWDGVMDPTGWLVSEKLDGVRAYWNGKDFVSRLGNVFAVPDWFKAGLSFVHLDGEFFIDRGRFQETSGIVRRLDKGEEWRKVEYRVFDLPQMDATFEARYAQLTRMTFPMHVSYVRHLPCYGIEDLKGKLEAVTMLGGEGLMLRNPRSKYERCRSNSLLKVKTFHDAEATVIGHTAGKGKHLGRVGALICRTPEGIDFNVGTGLSDQERQNPPRIGACITYRYQELTRDGVPRFPSYVGVRDFE